MTFSEDLGSMLRGPFGITVVDAHGTSAAAVIDFSEPLMTDTAGEQVHVRGTVLTIETGSLLLASSDTIIADGIRYKVRDTELDQGDGRVTRVMLARA
jgi:hypothetical protein